jgi:hypothetical protein
MNLRVSDGGMMATAGWRQTLEPIPPDQIVSARWLSIGKTLIQGSNAGLIHLEHYIGETHFIDYLRIWSSTPRAICASYANIRAIPTYRVL